MKNKERGSVTIVAFIAMMFFSIYSIYIYSNSVSTSIVQGKAIEEISNVYARDVQNIDSILNAE